MNAAIELLVGAMLVAGGLFALVGSWGLAKLSAFFMRLHGPTKASTLGVGGVLVGAMLFHGLEGAPAVRELLITLFLFMTAPISAHLLAKAAIARDEDAPPPQPSSDAPASGAPGAGADDWSTP